jgi:plastocyanin
VIITVKVGTNGKAIAVTSSSIKKGNVLSATIGTKLFVKSTISKIRIVAKLPKSSPVVKPVTTAITFSSLAANGTSNLTTTTALTLAFSADVTGLTAADLTLTGATKGALTRTSTGVYTLGVSGITVANGANLTVAVAKTGFIFTPSSRTVAANVSTSTFGFNSLAANGTSGSVSTTILTLIFSGDITGLSATDLTVVGATKGVLRKTGIGTYTLGVSGITVANGANLTVAVAKTGFIFTPSSRTVAANVATNMISFDSLSANGTSGSVSTTNLTLFFGADVAGLTTADITVTGATEGALTRIGTGVYSLGVSGITIANGSNLTVTVDKPGFTFTPSSRSVAANVATSTISFNALTANGESGSVSTTLLTMVFSADVAGLSASDIIIDGASRGTLTRTSAGVYTLGVSSITVANGGNITVAVSKPGFVFTPSIKTVTANVLTRAINFTSLTANGTGGSVSTTVLTLTFSADVTGLASTDITVIGATKGSLTRTGTGVYNLSISSITVGDGAELTVGVSKVGYVFTPSDQTVAAKVLTSAIDIISIDANGTSNSVSTTALTLTFSADVPGLSASNITLIGATKAALTSVGGGVYTLGITGMTVINGANLTVSVSKPGFSFEPASVSVAANVAPTPVTFSSVSANGTSATVTTTLLTLTFSRDITGLSAGDFTVTGATKGVLTGTGTGAYTLAISAIAVANGATVTVDVSKPGFTFTPASLTAAVNVAS